MPRPRKCKRVCRMPCSQQFGPLDKACGLRPAIEMSVEEYEAIRLIDLAGLTQEECAAQMSISRTSVQGMYDMARKKLADALVNGKPLIIGGGNYVLCDGLAKDCHSRRCGQKCDCIYQEENES